MVILLKSLLVLFLLFVSFISFFIIKEYTKYTKETDYKENSIINNLMILSVVIIIELFCIAVTFACVWFLLKTILII